MTTLDLDELRLKDYLRRLLNDHEARMEAYFEGWMERNQALILQIPQHTMQQSKVDEERARPYLPQV